MHCADDDKDITDTDDTRDPDPDPDLDPGSAAAVGSFALAELDAGLELPVLSVVISQTIPTRPSIRNATEYLSEEVSILQEITLLGHNILATGRSNPSGSPCLRRIGSDHSNLSGKHT
ncbi:uncharacterized protein TrAFT101_007905 [Trichoderma asperellum]|uniref:uncharacterized protein n=1 Tax=Trichoderma asperellum TaxID=101201 RepID=UPI003329B6A7|nr:hypothetical protein TrAFT101_007905 [Trichoderma asperellum]